MAQGCDRLLILSGGSLGQFVLSAALLGEGTIGVDVGERAPEEVRAV